MRNNTLLWVCFALLYTVTLSAQEERNELYGTLYDNETYDPVEGARIEILNYYPAKITYTDENGKFLLSGINVGRHRMLITANGFVDLQQGFEISIEQATSLRVALTATVEEPQTLEEELTGTVTTSSTKTAETVIDAPANTYIVSAMDIEERGYRYLVEVLEDIPEFEIQEFVANDRFNKISVRGIEGSEKILLLQDGIRISSAATTVHSIDRNYPIQHAKRIEIVLGPASALYGADAFSAVINIITKDGANIQGGELSSSYGMYQTLENTFQGGWQQGKTSFTINGNYYHSQEPNLSNFYPEEFEWITNQYEPFGTVLASPFSTDTIRIDSTPQPYSATRSAYSVHAKLNIENFEIGGSRRTQTSSSSWSTRPEYSPYIEESLWSFAINSAYANYTFKSKNNKLKITPQVSWNNYQLNDVSRFRNTYSGYAPAYKYAFSHIVEGKVDVNYNFNKFHKLVGGIQFQGMSALPKTSDLPFRWSEAENNEFYYLGTNIENADGESLAIPQELYFYKQNSESAYFQYQLNYKNWLAVTLGGRLFHLSLESNDGRFSNEFLNFNPRLGVVVKASEKFRFKLFYGEAFLAPSPEKLFEHFGSFFPVFDNNGNPTGFGGGFWHLPNPDIQSEKNRSAEVLGSFLSKNFTASINIYANQVRNLTNRELIFQDTFVGVPIDVVEIYNNDAAARTYGASFKFRYRQYFDANQRIKLDIYGGYTYSSGQKFRDGEVLRLPFNAEHTGRLGLTFGYKRFSIHTRGIFRSRSFNQTLFDANGVPQSQSNDPFFLLNAHVQYQVWQNFSRKFNIDIFVSGRNITDARYYNLSTNSSVNFGAVPQPPIRIVGGVVFTFDNNGTRQVENQ